MPPKRKTAAAKKTQKKVETEVKVETTVVAQDTEIKIEQTSVKRKHSEIVEDEDKPEPQEQESQVQESQETPVNGELISSSGSSTSLSDRMAKLKELKRRRATEVDQGNRRDRNLEFQRSKENPKLEARDERKKAEALKLLEKQEAEDKGEDYERKQFWKYSAESAAAWEKKMAKKAKMANNGFTDHSQAAHKKYIRLMSEFKPDMGAYTEKRMLDIERAIRNGEDPSDISAMANSLDYARLDDKPSKEAVDRLAEETKKQYVNLFVCLLY
ncbi:syf2 splicing factor family protein [Mucor ambiguus]|uniref:Pre-mRNA-splicing factor SYF2 n=1 Tax=Mucor ambiguus TaxID=91626 RepID=A0A0C9M5L0_9FUNG|nr:syf2 splicing factor family protein [Mucor ambiguus]